VHRFRSTYTHTPYTHTPYIHPPPCVCILNTLSSHIIITHYHPTLSSHIVITPAVVQRSATASANGAARYSRPTTREVSILPRVWRLRWVVLSDVLLPEGEMLGDVSSPSISPPPPLTPCPPCPPSLLAPPALPHSLNPCPPPPSLTPCPPCPPSLLAPPAPPCPPSLAPSQVPSAKALWAHAMGCKKEAASALQRALYV
jgi:hypothetical protein